MRKVKVIFEEKVYGDRQEYTINVPVQMTDEEVKQMCNEAVRLVGLMCYSNESVGYQQGFDAIYDILKEKGVCPEAYVMYIRLVNGYTCEKEGKAVLVIY